MFSTTREEYDQRLVKENETGEKMQQTEGYIARIKELLEQRKELIRKYEQSSDEEEMEKIVQEFGETLENANDNECYASDLLKFLDEDLEKQAKHILRREQQLGLNAMMGMINILSEPTQGFNSICDYAFVGPDTQKRAARIQGQVLRVKEWIRQFDQMMTEIRAQQESFKEHQESWLIK